MDKIVKKNSRKYCYYATDHQGSVVMMSDRDPDTSAMTKEEYAYDAWGEHADTDNLPTVANNIRYIGARLREIWGQESISPGDALRASRITSAKFLSCPHISLISIISHSIFA